ncbi:MAG TPA: carbohydrate kinase [Sulfurivirga caldicuralii]|nr:carbohydrate kinase [Sulfurivirga caldicuralii]
MRWVLGLDLGTSGLRGCVVNGREIIAQAQTAIEGQTPACWEAALDELMQQLQPHLAPVGHIVADATSSTVMLWRDHRPVSPVKLYCDTGHVRCAQQLADLLPPNSGAMGASSTLCKVLQLKARHVMSDVQIANQIDWLNAQFLGALPPTDWNNALKLGFDPVYLRWPQAIRRLIHPLPLPQVVPPGAPLGQVSHRAQRRWGLASDCVVHAGTTDSIAAFLATGAHQLGDAVTSLGSTLAIKLLSQRPVFAYQYGLYSHRLPRGWLVGGASNAGGKVLLQHFSLAEIQRLTPRLQPDKPTGLNYYPLPDKGERFPINDSNLEPTIHPVPEDRARFLQGLLEGLVKIESMGYRRLIELGATAPQRIFCAGGGCDNPVWMQLRRQALPAPLAKSASGDAAYGVTRLLVDAPA